MSEPGETSAGAPPAAGAEPGSYPDPSAAYLRSVMHALNQPLTAVGSYVEVAKQRLEPIQDPVVREALEGAMHEGERAVFIARELQAMLRRLPLQQRGGVELSTLLVAAEAELASAEGVVVDRSGPVPALSIDVEPLAISRSVLALVRGAVGGEPSGLQVPGGGSPACVRVRLSCAQEDSAVGIDVRIAAVDAPEGPGGELQPDTPLAMFARSVVADQGGEIILATQEPALLHYHVLFASP